MRYISIEFAKPGMVLASEVIDSLGRILISKNSVLTENFIKKLIQIGISSVYIEDYLSRDISIKPPISPQLRAQGLSAIKERNIDKCKLVSKKIVQEMLDQGIFALDMLDLRTYDDYTYSHSVNVAVLSCTIGLGMELDSKLLEETVLAALLHDMGKLQIPEEIVNKPERLTQEEFALIQTHPRRSYEMIKDHIDISARVKNAVLCHHENYDGSGYPNRFEGRKLSLMSSILHVADVYDALVSKRPYKIPYPPATAVSILKNGRGRLYAPEVVDAFLEYVPIYPKGSNVYINRTTIAVVVDNSGIHNERPIVRTYDGVDIDLSLEENSYMEIASHYASHKEKIKEQEKKRITMIKPFEKQNILVIDEKGDSFRNLEEKMSYAYNFRWAQSDRIAEGFINKYGYPDAMIVDIDNRDINNVTYLSGKASIIMRSIPLIVIGSYCDKETILDMRKIGIENYILKPFHIVYMQDLIHKLTYIENAV